MNIVHFVDDIEKERANAFRRINAGIELILDAIHANDDDKKRTTDDLLDRTLDDLCAVRNSLVAMHQTISNG